MGSRQQTVDFILEQLAAAGPVSARRMFGEYGLYGEGKLFALVCDDQLFLKPTQAGRDFAPDLGERSPYPGAKPYLHVPGDYLDDAAWLAELVVVTVAALPAPRLKERTARR